MQHFPINNLDAISKHIISLQKKLVYIAGSSASGKSYCAELISKDLQSKGKRVISISSDNYYSNQTRLHYLLYGTFDHPHLIEYDLLADNIAQLLKTGSTNIPEYSFKEWRRVWSHVLDDPFDIIIIEWLYTIAQLPLVHDPIMIYVDSPTEELVFRRLVRDQERLAEPLATQIINLARVFPMWNIFWASQKKKADMVINNDYEVLSKYGKQQNYKLYNDTKASLGKLLHRSYVTDFEYNDTYDDNGVIVISEVYKQKHGLLDSVKISRRSEALKTHTESFSSITMELHEPGSLTQLHILLQLSGLKLQRTVKKIESTYEKTDGSIIVVKERRGRLYISQ